VPVVVVIHRVEPHNTLYLFQPLELLLGDLMGIDSNLICERQRINDSIAGLQSKIYPKKQGDESCSEFPNDGRSEIVSGC